MAVATLSNGTQERLAALRDRFSASRERSAKLLHEFQDDASERPVLPAELTDTLARLKDSISMEDAVSEGSANAGLPWLAGANNKQHR